MVKLVIPPGVVNDSPRRLNSSNWREVNLVRWENNTLRPIGGWEQLAYTNFASRVRAIHRWVDNSGDVRTAFLCEEHCYVHSRSTDATIDVTPIGGIEPPPAISGGYGDEDYNEYEYGTPRGTVYRNAVTPPCYTVDNWGQELRVMTSTDGRLLRWDPSAPYTPLSVVAGAPINNRTFVVTPERHVMLFGAGGDLSLFKWSDQENDSVWVPSTTSKAGEFNVEPRAPIVGAKVSPFGVVMFTTRAAYTIRYIGLPYIYQYEKIGDSPSPLNPAACVSVPNGLVWMGVGGFWAYNGASVAPMDCPVLDWVVGNIDVPSSRFYSSAMVVPNYNEAWFFYSGIGGAGNDRAVIFNYQTGAWSMGKIARYCGFGAHGYDQLIMSDGSRVFSHDVGYMYPGAPDKPWAESFTLNVNTGSSLSTIKQMLPDVVGDPSSITFKLIKVNNPSSSLEILSQPKNIRPNGYVDVRETARDFRLRVEMVGASDWSIGPIDVDVAVRGKK